MSLGDNDRMTTFGLAARWTHLVCGLGLVGIFSASLVAGRSDRATAQTWASRTLSLARWLTVAALLSGVGTLAYQVVVVAGRAGALLDPAIWLRLLMHSQFGTVWLVRHGLLVLLAALVLLREREDSPVDWTAWRLEAWTLGRRRGAERPGLEPPRRPVDRRVLPLTEQDERGEQDEQAVPDEPDRAELAVHEQAQPDGRIEQGAGSSRDHHHLVCQRPDPREQRRDGEPARQREGARGPRLHGGAVAGPGEKTRAEDAHEAEPADQVGPARRQAERGHSIIIPSHRLRG